MPGFQFIFKGFQHDFALAFRLSAWTYGLAMALILDRKPSAMRQHFRKFLTNEFGCPEGSFLRVWVSKRRHVARLAKAMTKSNLSLYGITMRHSLLL